MSATKFIAALAMFGCTTAALSQNDAPNPSPWLPTTIGLHIASAHAAPGFNNVNPGLYARWGSGPLKGLTIGHITSNSLGNASTYVAYTAQTDRYATSLGSYSAALSAGVISGYYKSAGNYTAGAPVPSGATILGRGLARESTLAQQGQQRAGAWPVFEERAAESYRGYYRYIPQGPWSVEYTVRLNNAGTFEFPPARVEAMYAPEIFGETPIAPLVVQP